MDSETVSAIAESQKRKNERVRLELVDAYELPDGNLALTMAGIRKVAERRGPAPMSLARVKAANKESYKAAPCGTWIETWYFDALLELILIQRDGEGLT